MARVGVIGGGISGLAAAFRLQARGHSVRVFEGGPRPGGKIHSERVDGYLVESGPNTFLSSRQGLVALIADLGIADRVIESRPEAKRRYLLRADGLTNVGPKTLLTGALLSARGRLRMLREPLVKPSPEPDPSVTAFFTHRLGAEAAALLADPLVAGIYAGDPDRLSMSASFPNVFAMVQTHGSLLRGAWAARQGPRGHVSSFREGMGTLVDALVARLDVLTDAPVERIEPTQTGWSVWRGGATEAFDALVLAVPPGPLAQLLEPLAPDAAAAARAIRCAPAVAVALGFEAAALPRPLDGFGFLVPRGAGLAVVGAQWSSAFFAGRAPAGRALIRSIVGGDRCPEAIDLDDEALVTRVLADLSRAMGPMPKPVLTRIIRWPKGIPQYDVGHAARVARIEAAQRPGLHFAGNGYYGVSVPACVDRADALAARLSAG